jgi:hypothetical protein
MISKWSKYVGDDTRYQRIPERVLKAIFEQQNASEKLVGWFQLAVVIFFGLLYAVSPKTFSREETFELVPWFLAIYLVVTLVRLYLAYRHRMSVPLLYLSVVIDMSLLLGMIWSFHLQYQQPPSFYLKSPTVLYVFIFIALRALRFEARYVITAGIVAATGWTTLAVYATLASGGMQVVTNNYVDENKPVLNVDAAVATGPVIFGAVGDETRMEYTVIGDAVNLSAKLEKHTKAEGVRALCTAKAFDTALRQGYQPQKQRKRLKNRKIEGVAEPLDIVVLAF